MNPLLEAIQWAMAGVEAITPTVTVGKRPLFSVEDAQAIMLGPAAPKAQERTS